MGLLEIQKIVQERKLVSEWIDYNFAIKDFPSSYQFFPIFLPSIIGQGVISLVLKVCHEASLHHGSLPTSLSFLILAVLASEQVVEFC